MSTPRTRRGRGAGIRTPLGTPRRSQRHTPKPTPTPARVEDVLEQGENYVIKATNSPVPVQVQEVLRADPKVVGVKLDPSGWAMLVTGNKLLMWRFLTNQLSTKCYDVTLPSSGKGWNVNLLTFTAGTSDSRLSVLGCSGEGDLHWWSDVLEGVGVTLRGSIDIGEGVVFSVNPVWDTYHSDDCLVTSSQANMWLISPSTSEGRLCVQSLTQPQGMLSGLGRRVTSMFFGSQALSVVDTRRVLTQRTSQGDVMAFILTSSNIQRWNVSTPADQLAVDTPVLDHVKQAVLVNGWVGPSCSPSVSLLDLQVGQGCLALLFATSEGTGPAELGLAVFPLYCSFSSSDLKRIVRLQQTVSSVDSSLLAGFTLHSSSEVPIVAVVSKAGLILDNVVDEVFGPQAIPFSQSDMIIGAGHQGDQLLLFTRSHGVVNIAQTTPTKGRAKKKSLATPRLHEGLSLDTSLHSRSTHLVSGEATAEAAEMLETAFAQFLDGNIARAMSVCEEKFPMATSTRGGVNTLGDMATVHLSQLILDDPPPQVDPSDSSSGGQASMIIVYRLQQKIEAHGKYVRFLEEVGLLERLTYVRHGGAATVARVTPTRQVMQEHAELIQAALSLRKVHDQFVDGVIGVVLQGRPIPPAMSHNDMFYSAVSTFHGFFPSLIRYQNHCLADTDNTQEKVKVVLSGSTVLEAVLHGVLFYRQSKASMSESSEVKGGPQQPPWTTSEGSTGLRTVITDQLDMVVQVGVAHAEDQDLPPLWSTAAGLMDILFDGYRTQISCLNDNNKIVDAKAMFVAQRKNYLTILLKHGQLPSVCELAERYHDFRILVTLCQESGDSSKLKDYVRRFSEQGFSDFLFKMYLDEGNLQQLLSLSKDFPSELTLFLESHPHLAWLHHLATQDYAAAHKTLSQLAHQEAKHARRKKTLLSLAKLSLLACTSGDTSASEEDQINTSLHHIHFQEGVTLETLEAAGMDSALMPPLVPMEVIKLYVGEHSPDSEEEDFIQVLKYITFCSKSMEKTVVDSLFLYTWCQALLKDSWNDMSIEEPVKELQKTFFFRIVEQLFHKDVDVRDLLPELTSLVQHPSIMEAGLSKSHVFKYLMKTGYEHVSRAYS